jgi:RNA polymerase sigma-70 factor (ECF subfamily)
MGEPIDTEDEALWEAWHRLREADREVLALIAWEELSVAEASRVLGCPAPVFSIRLHRARRRLEGLLAQPAGAVRPVSTLSEAS